MCNFIQNAMKQIAMKYFYSIKSYSWKTHGGKDVLPHPPPAIEGCLSQR